MILNGDKGLWSMLCFIISRFMVVVSLSFLALLKIRRYSLNALDSIQGLLHRGGGLTTYVKKILNCIVVICDILIAYNECSYSIAFHKIGDGTL